MSNQGSDKGFRSGMIWEQDKYVGETSNYLIESKIYLGWMAGEIVDPRWYGVSVTTIYNNITGVRVQEGEVHMMYSRADARKRAKNQLLEHIWEIYNGMYETMVAEKVFYFNPEKLVGVRILEEGKFREIGEGEYGQDVLPDCLMQEHIKVIAPVATEKKEEYRNAVTARRIWHNKEREGLVLKKNDRVGVSRFEERLAGLSNIESARSIDQNKKRSDGKRSIGNSSSSGELPYIHLRQIEGRVEGKEEEESVDDEEDSRSQISMSDDLEKEVVSNKKSGAPTEWLGKSK
jgi:hypothetical protein